MYTFNYKHKKKSTILYIISIAFASIYEILIILVIVYFWIESGNRYFAFEFRIFMIFIGIIESILPISIFFCKPYYMKNQNSSIQESLNNIDDLKNNDE